MNTSPFQPRPLWQWAILLGLLGFPIAHFGLNYSRRPPQKPLTKDLFEGIHYQRVVRTDPRPMMVHIVTLDLTQPGLKPFITPSNPSVGPEHTQARTATHFVKEFGVQLAVNGSFFYKFREETPWDFYPHAGDRVSAIGTTISNTKPYSALKEKYPTICFSAQHRAEIRDNGACPAGTVQAIAGNETFLAHGQIALKQSQWSRDWDKPYPRTAIGVDRSGSKVWLIVIDGKQPLYSEGATMQELGEISAKLGIDAALNLDGGGSVTLVIATPNGPRILNSPIQAKIPTWERPIANHLGFYANSLRATSRP
jgi:Phosphodiester glycosidase